MVLAVVWRKKEAEDEREQRTDSSWESLLNGKSDLFMRRGRASEERIVKPSWGL
jgi:hypothetical protein